MESAFNFCAIINNEKFFSNYLNKGDFQTGYLMKNISKNPEVFTNEELRKAVVEKRSEVEKAIKGMKHYSTEQLAKMANMTEIYLYTYNLLSLDTHGNVKSVIDNHIIKDIDDNIVFNFKPVYENQKLILLTSMGIILNVISGIEKYFDIYMHGLVKIYDSKISEMRWHY